MEVATLAGSLVFLILVVHIGKKLNNYSEEKYGYTPISIGTIFSGMIPYALFAAGYLGGSVYFPIVIILVLGSVIGLFLWISKRSTILVAMGATPLLIIFGLPTALFLFFSCRDNDYNSYYDE